MLKLFHLNLQEKEYLKFNEKLQTNNYELNKEQNDAFKDLVKKHIDILFANEIEAKKLFQTENLNESIKEISEITEIAAEHHVDTYLASLLYISKV